MKPYPPQVGAPSGSDAKSDSASRSFGHTFHRSRLLFMVQDGGIEIANAGRAAHARLGGRVIRKEGLRFGARRHIEHQQRAGLGHPSSARRLPAARMMCRFASSYCQWAADSSIRPDRGAAFVVVADDEPRHVDFLSRSGSRACDTAAFPCRGHEAGERPLFLEVPCGAAMQDRALVPDQHIAHAPAV